MDGVINPVVVALHIYDLSVCSTTVLVRSMHVYAMVFELDAHIETVMLVKSHHHRLMIDIFADNFNSLLSSFDLPKHHVLNQRM